MAGQTDLIRLGTPPNERYTPQIKIWRAGLSESDSFIHEVSEEVRRDRLFGIFRRWGWLIAALLLLIVGGAAANEWRKHRIESDARNRGDALRAALLDQNSESRIQALADLGTEEGSAGVFARLAHAGALADAGETDKAADVLVVLSTDVQVAEPYRSLAALRRVMLLGSGIEVSERLATLQGLTAPGAPFRPLALEQRALVHLDQDDREAAIADLEEVIASPGATQGLISRAQQLIVAAGGALSVSGIGNLPAPTGG
jgi:hypothetical protein